MGSATYNRVKGDFGELAATVGKQDNPVLVIMKFK